MEHTTQSRLDKAWEKVGRAANAGKKKTTPKLKVGKRTTPMGPANKGRSKGKAAPNEEPPKKAKDAGKPPKSPGTQVAKKSPGNQVATRKTTQPTNTASSGKSVSVKESVKRSLSLSSPKGKGRATSKFGAMLAVGAFVADKVFGHGAKSRTERNARIKERQGKADFAKEKSTLLGPDGNLKPAKKSKYGTPPKKPSRTAPPLKEMGTIKQHPIDKVTGASAAPAPKPINKPAGTKNTPDMFSQFMSNLTGVKVTPNNSKGPVKHDSNGTTASNQTGGALFGLIKDKKKKGSK